MKRVQALAVTLVRVITAQTIWPMMRSFFI
jgi:hypothetical protein